MDFKGVPEVSEAALAGLDSLEAGEIGTKEEALVSALPPGGDVITMVGGLKDAGADLTPGLNEAGGGRAYGDVRGVVTGDTPAKEEVRYQARRSLQG